MIGYLGYDKITHLPIYTWLNLSNCASKLYLSKETLRSNFIWNRNPKVFCFLFFFLEEMGPMLFAVVSEELLNQELVCLLIYYLIFILQNCDTF